MTGTQHRSHDDRRARRRPSAWFALIFLAATLAGAVSIGLHNSRPVAQRTEGRTQSVDDGGGAAPIDPTEHADIQRGDLRLTRDAESVRHNVVPLSLAESLADIERESDPGAQEERMTALVTGFSLAEIPSALNQLQDSTNRMAFELGARLMRRWAEVDPQAASAWAVVLPEGPFRSTVLDQASIAWAEINWADAADWARQLPDGTERDRVMRVVAEETVRSEPVEALRLAMESAPSAERDDLIRHAAMEWAGLDAASAEQWARQIDDTNLRSQVLAVIAVALADQDARAAATLAVSDLPTGRVQEDAIVSILNRWVQVDADAAASWVIQFPPGQLKQDAIASVVAIWSLDDFSRAHEWLDTVTRGGRL
jgi:hypothetical protein